MKGNGLSNMWRFTIIALSVSFLKVSLTQTTKNFSFIAFHSSVMDFLSIFNDGALNIEICLKTRCQESIITVTLSHEASIVDVFVVCLAP